MPVINCPFPSCEYVTPDVTDQLAATILQIHASGAHVTAPAPRIAHSNTAAKVEKVRRPTISTAGSTEEWSYFLTRWQDYVDATSVSGKDLVIQLLECCDEELRKDLTRTNGGSLTNNTEKEVLAAIKNLAVQPENTMVARVALHEMKQDRDEPVRSFGARIRGQAGVCRYSVEYPTCNVEVSYTKHVLRDVLTMGIADPEIQLELLSQANQDMTLEEAFQFVDAKESDKRSAVKLSSQSVDSMRSSYRRQKQEPIRSSQTEKCQYCGKTGRGRNTPSKERKKQCPAYGQICNHCGRLHHLVSVCRSKAHPKATHPSINTEAAIYDDLTFNAICSLNTVRKNSTHKPMLMDHHVYDQIHDCWSRSSSKPQPTITLVASINTIDYTLLGYKLSTPTKSATLLAITDTGCQSCLASLSLVKKLGLQEEDIIPVTTTMRNANKNRIKIMGAVIVRLKGEISGTGEYLETRQIVYITKETDQFFLSREACTHLGIISTNFPSIGKIEAQTTCSTMTNSTTPEYQPDSALTSNCSCPRRQLPPPIPQSIPFTATEDNREKLQQWLTTYYGSSAFNTCQHQPLPMMTGPPLRLMTNPDARPVTHHKPIPVPLHWLNDVKAGLDQDTNLGVIEPVPIGEPVTWCHRMVICAKKNGKPRRTVDLQPLNVHATRETHHTQSPFHQARSVPHNTKKTVFDCWNGYHSVPLHPDDKHLTTFITPWGHYQYKVAPQGYIASGDGYTRRFDEITSDIPNKTKCIDDTLLCYLPHPTWQDTFNTREEALRKRHMRLTERWEEHTRILPPLCVGDHVRIQNQMGPHPNKWDKTGLVVEVKQYNQYLIRVDGSKRVTLRNRKFLRKFKPILDESITENIVPNFQHYHGISEESTSQRITQNPKGPITVLPDPPAVLDSLAKSPSKLNPIEESTTPPIRTPVTSDLDPSIVSPTNTASTPQSSNNEVPKKIPLALRRLMDFNKKGLKE